MPANHRNGELRNLEVVAYSTDARISIRRSTNLALPQWRKSKISYNVSRSLLASVTKLARTESSFTLP
jgi:hypothetical protein